MPSNSKLSHRLMILTMKGLPVLSHLTDSECETLSGITNVWHVKKGQIILRQGDNIDSYYTIAKGVARIYRVAFSGKAVTVHMRHRGDSLGDESLFRTDPSPSPSSAQALSSMTLLVFERRKFLSFCMQHPPLLAHIAGTLARRLAKANEDITELHCMKAEMRVAKALVTLLYEFGCVVPLTHQQIADMIGLARETTSRILEQMDESQVISCLHPGIAILDKHELKELSVHRK